MATNKLEKLTWLTGSGWRASATFQQNLIFRFVCYRQRLPPVATRNYHVKVRGGMCIYVYLCLCVFMSIYVYVYL